MHSEATARPKTAAPRAVARHVERSYPLWFYIPGGLVYVVDGRVVDSIEQGAWSAETAERREAELLAWLGTQGF